MWWYTYILISKRDGSWYIGCTNDLKGRKIEHNSGQVASTRNRKPFNIIYFEACIDKTDAFRRERYLKSGYGRRYLKSRLKEYLRT